MSRVRGVAEIVLNVKDIERARRFYADVLGFQEFARFPETAPTIAFLSIAPLDTPLGVAHPQTLALIDPARHESVAGRFDAPTYRNSTLNHLAFEIDEARFDEERERLISLGLDPRTVEFGWMRAKALFFRDPEGNAIELIAHDSTAPISSSAGS